MAHVGMSRMKALAQNFCWWPNMDREVEQMVGECNACMDQAHNPPAAILHPWEIARKPWSRIHLDHAGPFLGRLFFIVVDAHTKWVDAYTVASTSTEHTLEKLRTSFAVQGIPDSIVTDNASGFTSGEFAGFMVKNGIRHVTSAPYHPSTNGAAERTVQEFKKTLKKLTCNSRESVETQVCRFLFTFRNTPTTTTGMSPAEMVFKQQPKTRLHQLKPSVKRYLDDPISTKREGKKFRGGRQSHRPELQGQ